MLVFLTGAGGQGKTTTMRRLAQLDGWVAFESPDQAVIDEIDPLRKRFRSSYRYLSYRTMSCHRLTEMVEAAIARPDEVAVFDICPFLVHAAILRRLCSCENELGNALGRFEARVLHLLGQVQNLSRTVVAEGALFFVYPVGRITREIEKDGYRSGSLLSHTALEKIVRSLLIEHHARFVDVPSMGPAATSDWIRGVCDRAGVRPRGAPAGTEGTPRNSAARVTREMRRSTTPHYGHGNAGRPTFRPSP